MKRRQQGIRLSLLIPALALIVSGAEATAGLIARDGAADGILVTFRGQAVRQPSLRDALHARTGTRVVYRAHHFPVDFVTPKTGHTGSRDLERLCGRYRASTMVADCRVNRPLEPADDDHGSAPTGGTTRTTSPQCHLAQMDQVGPDLARAYRDRKLTPLWAQTETGALLAKGLLDRWAQSEALPTVSAAVLDVGFDILGLGGPLSTDLQQARRQKNISPFQHPWTHDPSFQRRQEAARSNAHGTQVANLKNDPLVGEASHVRLDRLVVVRDEQDVLRFADGVAGASPGAAPAVLNLSLTPSAEGLPPFFNQLAGRMLIVMAAGNLYPQPVSPAQSELRAILVGSSDPSGFVSDFSSLGDRVALLAPSDEWILSREMTTGFTRFAGTSGAVPLVEGALDMALALLSPSAAPSGLSVPQAIRLLQSTALPAMNSREVPPRDGAGILNALRLVAVARRLRAEGWNEKDESARQKLLADPRLYDFTQAMESEDRGAWQRDFDTARALQEGLAKVQDCQTFSQGLAALNKAFLLTERTGATAAEKAIADRARAALADAYRSTGFDAIAEFYDDFDPALALGNAERKAVGDDQVLASADPHVRAAALRTLAAAYQGAGTPADTTDKRAILLALSKASRDAASSVRATAAREAGRLAPGDALPILTPLLDTELHAADGAPIRLGIAIAASELPQEAGYPLLRRLIEQGDVSSRSIAAGAAGRLPDHGPALLRLALQHPESETALAVLHAARQLPTGGEAIVEPLARHSDPQVRQAVMESAPSFSGGDKLLALGVKDTAADVAQLARTKAQEWADAEAAKPAGQRDDTLIQRLHTIGTTAPARSR